MLFLMDIRILGLESVTVFVWDSLMYFSGRHISITLFLFIDKSRLFKIEVACQ